MAMPKDIKGTQGEGTPNSSDNEVKGGEKLFSQDDVNKLTGEVRKEVREQLSKEFEEKLTQTTSELEKRIQKEREDAERVAKLSAEEREKELKAQQEQQLKERERELALRENKLVAHSKLVESGMPIALADFVISTDQSEMEKKIEQIKEVWSKSLEESVSKKLDSGMKRDVGRGSATPRELKRTF